MKSMMSILFWLFAVPFVINGTNVSIYYPDEVERLDILAENGTIINEVLMLKVNGYLGEGGFGVVYEGVILTDNNRSVAIKFFQNQKILYCEREMEMLCYLKAYKNESVEKYGIPVVYYYGEWKSYIIIALTKLDNDLRHIANEVTNFDENPLDILILFRDFIYQSKYIHSHGLRHDDIKPENIMVRGHRSFLIDFNLSSKIMENGRGGTTEYACQRFITNETRRAIDDWECFLYTMSVIIGNGWFGPRLANKSRIKNLVIEDESLAKVIKAFAHEVFTNNKSKTFPNYNRLEKLISREIAKKHPNDSPKFSWVQRAAAEASSVRNIKNIADPKSINFNKYAYPDVVYLSSSSGSHHKAILIAHASTSSKISSKKVCCFTKQPSE